jgi:hypothetical protein
MLVWIGDFVNAVELRGTRRYRLSLPVTIHAPNGDLLAPRSGKTRDVSSQGVYFFTESDLKPGSAVHLTMTIPVEITGGTEVFIRFAGRVVRTEPCGGKFRKGIGVAAKIQRYEFGRHD